MVTETSKYRYVLIVVAVVGFILFVLLGPAVYLYTELLWFKELHFTPVFLKILGTKALIGLSVGAFFFVLLSSNLMIARRFAPRARVFPHEIIEISPVPDKLINRVLLLGSLAVAVLVGLGSIGHWETILKFLNSTSFHLQDPIFHRDVSFYVFTLPVYEWIRSALINAVFLTLIATAGIHFFDNAIEIRAGNVRFAPHVKAHLSLLAGAIVFLKSWGYIIQAYGLLMSERGTVFGAGYTDINAILPALKILTVISIFAGIILILNIYFKGWILPAGAFGILMTASLLVGVVYPQVIQQYIVSPNEIAKERPFIKNNIKFTRKAYSINKMSERQFPAESKLNATDIANNSATIKNIRLWDTRPLVETYGQIQIIRPYYVFRDVDVDRYTFGGSYRQTLLSPREMESGNLPQSARTWVNQKLIFTHGNGLCMSPVNVSTGEGLPRLIVKNIPPISDFRKLNVTQPRIYYGEGQDDFVVVRSGAKEFDYPKGDLNVYTRYSGRGGVQLTSFLRKSLFALRFSSLPLILSQFVDPQSRIMFHREIIERVKNIAPFLAYDGDPYMVLSRGRLYWVLDAYTFTGRYPYSQPAEPGVNYIRNSVKVLIDAYNGTVRFYVVDKEDPLIATYKKIFPGLFIDFTEMPADIKKHIRYPEDLFSIQSKMLLTYHMTDPQVFYNKEDMWSTPNEIFESSEVPVQPYYIILSLPGEKKEEFVLMLPFTPVTRNNMRAWLGARCDAPHYGELILFKFPKDRLIFGPLQVEARIDQDTSISRQLTLWNQSGSRVIRGNLLVIPISNSILYVEPLYLRAESSQIPELKRVVVAFGPRLVMENNLQAALSKLFGAPRPEVRPVPTVSGKISSTVNQAKAQFEKAFQLLRKGDFTGFGDEMAKLGKTLDELSGQTISR